MTDLRRHVPPLTLVWDDEAPGALHRTVDGTLVFADVSGFTALTERLSRQGRIGAEEIVEALNRVFGPMLTIAAARGGELLKFGGDALLFLFRGDDHAEQACDAAVEMRASLRAAAAVPTSAGRFSLSMSVGVHSGDIELFLVGSPTRELLVLGPAAPSAGPSPRRPPSAGQVVVSPATAAPAAPRRQHPPARRRGAAAAPPRVPHSAPAPPGIRAPRTAEPGCATLFPTALGEYLAPGPPDPEHRVATIAFVRFSGTDAHSRGAGSRPLAEALHARRHHRRGRPGGRGRHPAGHRPRHRRRQVLPRLGRAGHPARTTRAGCCAPCGGSPTPTSRCPCSSGVNRGHVFAAEVGIERARPTRRWATPPTPRPGSWPRRRPASIHAHPGVLEHSRTRFAVDTGRALRDEGQGRCRCRSTPSARRSARARASTTRACPSSAARTRPPPCVGRSRRR